MKLPTPTISLFIFPIFIFIFVIRADLPGTWELIHPNVGIASMHTAVTHYNTVILLDRTNIGPSKTLLPSNHCRFNDEVLKRDCYAHSVLFDLTTNEVRPLTILTDTWCSSGAFLPDGTLLHTGGDLDGNRKIRKFSPCERNGDCDWEELDDVELSTGRWYATNQVLPDGSVAIVGGRVANSIEYYPPKPTGVEHLPFLADMHDRQMDNLYPYVHLLPDGNLFIFANNRAVLYEHNTNAIIRGYPILDGGPRNYPSAGSSIMLALEGPEYNKAVIVICGGAQYGAYLEKSSEKPARGSCGRIVATDEDPVWEMEDMPSARVMGDMVMLPTGEALIINGAQAGSQGFERASNPCLNPVLYRPNEPNGLRFMVLNPGTVPRMYHSTANLLPDGRVLLAGSNPHYYYNFKQEFPTELRLEAFSPEYLSQDRANLRPIVERYPEKIKYGQPFDIVVFVGLPVVGIIEVNMGNAPFATHSFSQGQRLVKLIVTPAAPEVDGVGKYRIGVRAPPNPNVAPPGYYMVFAVNNGVPSVAKWVQVVL